MNPRSVSVILDLPSQCMKLDESLSLEFEGSDQGPTPSHTVDAEIFPFSDIVLLREAKDDDSLQHTKITVSPFESLLLSKMQNFKPEKRDERDSLPAIDGASDERSSKKAWELFFERSDACRFNNIAMTVGIVQKWSEIPWRITSYAGSGGFADVYVAKGPRHVSIAVHLTQGDGSWR